MKVQSVRGEWVEVDLLHVVDSMSGDEKSRMFRRLSQDVGASVVREVSCEVMGRLSVSEMSEVFRELHPFEQKRMLCDALYVPSYLDDAKLRESLEPIIKSR